MKKALASFCIFSLLGLNTLLPVRAEMDTKSFTIVRNNAPLKSIIDSKYNGFEFTMKNHTKNKLIVKNFVVDNATSAQDAYQNVKRNGWGAAGITFVYGWNYALSTLGLSLVGATIAWPFFVGASMFGNIGAKQEARRFASATIKQEGIIKSKEKINFKAFAEEGLIPTVTIVLEDPEGKNYAYTHSYFGTEFACLGTNEEINADLEERIKNLNAKSTNPDEQQAANNEQTNQASNEQTTQVKKERATQVNKEQTTQVNKEETDNVKNAIQNAYLNNNTKKSEQETNSEQKSSTKNSSGGESSKYTMEESALFKQYNTGIVTDPNVKTKQQIFEDNKNFVSF